MTVANPPTSGPARRGDMSRVNVLYRLLADRPMEPPLNGGSVVGA